MGTEEEIQVKADELADRFENSKGTDQGAMRDRAVLDWVLENSDDL